MTIRRMKAEDYDAVMDVWRLSGLSVEPENRDSRESIARQLEKYESSMLVAEEGGRVVGVVLGTHDLRKGWINRTAVIPEFRHRGVARDLVLSAEEEFRRLGLKIFALLVESDNVVSAKAVEAVGYQHYGHIRYFGKFVDEHQP